MSVKRGGSPPRGSRGELPARAGSPGASRGGDDADTEGRSRRRRRPQALRSRRRRHLTATPQRTAMTKRSSRAGSKPAAKRKPAAKKPAAKAPRKQAAEPIEISAPRRRRAVTYSPSFCDRVIELGE